MDASASKSLKEKWRDHWDTRHAMLSPSQQTNICGVIFFWFFTLSLMYSSLWITIPSYSTGFAQNMMLTVVLVIFIESCINWILAAQTKVNRVTSCDVVANGELPEGWRICVTCQVPTPPRSHHCKICNACVLKRDHHCFFTGTLV